MTELNRNQARILEKALWELSRKTGVSIISEMDYETGAYTYFVNWCAMGTKTADEAMEYAQRLMDTSKLVKALNELQIVRTKEKGNRYDDIDDYVENIVNGLELVKGYSGAQLVMIYLTAL